MIVDTDYLVVGAGAVGMIFTDELITHSDATVLLVDRRDRPGGHWTETYPFVRLHQPSVYYGAGSMELGSRRMETEGPNAGLYQQASGAEVAAYFERLLRDRLLPSGRVTFLPLHDYQGDWSTRHQVVSRATGSSTTIRVRRKVVDTTFYQISTPQSHRRPFRAFEGARVVAPHQLPQTVAPGTRYVVAGGGKTSMDVVSWLLTQGVAADDLTWIVPRDSWLVNRETVQPGYPGFLRWLHSQVDRLEASASAVTLDDLYDRLEGAGELLRIDRGVRPRMFHGATASAGEIDLLRRVRRIIRAGHLQRIERRALVFAGGVVVPTDPDAVYIDCTARGIGWRPTRPVFEVNRITMQFVREGRLSLSAAAIAFVEAAVPDWTQQNALCRPIPYEESLSTWPKIVLADLINGEAWSRDPGMAAWMRTHRLRGFGASPVESDRVRVAALRERIRALRPRAVDNLKRLIASLGDSLSRRSRVDGGHGG